MTEEENTGAETVEAEAEATEVAPAAESEEAQPEKKANAKPDARTRNEYNWAEARKKMDALDRQNREMAEELKKIKEPVRNAEEDFGIRDDDLIEGKHLKDLKKEIKALKSALEYQQSASVETRLQHKFPDFDDVVTKENLELLKETEPELAFSLSNTPDLFQQGVVAYKLLKGMKQQDDKLPEKKKALVNSMKPVSANAVSKSSAIGNAHLFENGLTPELKKQLWNEMQQAKKFA